MRIRTPFCCLSLLALLSFSTSQPARCENNAVKAISKVTQALERIRIAPDKAGFIGEESQKPFVVRGFNYDRHHDNRLLEEYWDSEWNEVESSFREMKALGANAVRIHLQVEAFLEGPTKANEKSLEKLRQLLVLAHETGLYLNITGLGCYHKQDVPAWYEQLDEQGRWAVQAIFWETIAEACKDSSAVFCYDLMNEPVVPGGNSPQKDWLGPGFGGKHYVQFISLDRQGRNRPEVAKAWIGQLVTAIRKHDAQTLITVGMVDWSLDKPGLTSGFVPTKVSDQLDFISVHIYPETNKLEEAKSLLDEFAAVGKPVVIEEIYPLKGTASELISFLTETKGTQAGIFTFYWGRTPEELDALQTIGGAINADWLRQVQKYWSP